MGGRKSQDWAQQQSWRSRSSRPLQPMGLTGVYDDRRLLYDNSFSARLKRNENDIRQQSGAPSWNRKKPG